jgi:WD40 repeat protein
LPYRLRFDGPGKRLAVTTDQNQFHIFDVQTGASHGSFTQKGTSVLAFSPDSEELVLGGVDGRLRTGKNVFDSQARSLPGPLPASEAWCLAFSHDGNTLAAGYDHERGSKPQTLLLWDLKSKTARTFAGHHATVMALAISPDGKTFATASYDRSVRLWDLASGECRKKLTGHTGPVRALAFSPDGLQIASAGSDLSIKTWNVKTGSLQNSWRGHDNMIRSLTFSRDGERLISAANDRTIKIWNAKDQTLVRTIADEAHVQSVACSPDGRLLASGNENHTVEIWELASGALVKTLPGHVGKVRSVVFSPDGKTLASGGEGKTVRLWNVLTGQELLVLPTEHFINGLAFDPRSKTLAAALHDGSVKIWAAE